MCGIAGLVSKNSLDANKYLKKMVSSMAHRGPDADGFFNDNNIGIGHRRLSIIDLNERSNQPLYSDDGRYLIVFNGEIYNYKKLKSKIINKYDFKTDSDTEVLLASYIIYGKNFINELNGCFAFAIYDKIDKELFISRDRLGIKPFYFYYDENIFLFSSEIRSILSTGLIKKEINHLGLKQFLCFQSTSYPNTIIENIKMLAPGAYAKFSLNDFKLSMEKYWSINIQAKSLHSKNYYSIVSEVKKVLISSVKKRMVADVDVAAFLSGGIDSSIIVGIMSQLGIKNINTFSLVHDENEFDESFFSDLVASKFKTNHYKVKISKDELVSEVTAALNQFDSPSADGLNSYIVSKKIREIGIKVALSGLGGDELFAGYPQFKYWYYLSKYRKLFSSLKIFNFLLNKSNNYHYKLSKIIFSDFSSNSINQIF